MSNIEQHNFLTEDLIKNNGTNSNDKKDELGSSSMIQFQLQSLGGSISAQNLKIKECIDQFDKLKRIPENQRDETETARYNQLLIELIEPGTLYQELERRKKEFEDKVNEVSVFYKVDIKRDIDGNITNIDLEEKQMYTQKQYDDLQEILNKYENNEPLSQQEYKFLRNALLYDDRQSFFEDYLGKKFKYNINRNINQSLLDLRNYHNFRNSNNVEYDNNKKQWIAKNDSNITTLNGSSASRSFYMSKNDFYWSQNYNDIKNQLNQTQRQSVQNIILNEFQPKLQYGLGKEVLDIAGGSLQLLTQNLKGAINVVANVAGAALRVGATAYYNEQIDKISKNPDELYNQELAKPNGMNKNPMYYVQRLFDDGRWLNTYQLPFVANGQVKTDYLKLSKDTGTWNIGGLTDGLTDNSAMQKVLKDRISLSVPTTPTFSLDNAQLATYGEITIDFYLINKDDQYLQKNFQFMHALFAGTQWLLMEVGAVTAPNVYHVLVPGRFQIHWASLESSFEAVGKLRTNQNMYIKHGQGNKQSPDYVGSIQADTLWPEAWHVTLTINPLTQWNFNTYIDYHVNGFGDAQKRWLATEKRNWANSFGMDLKNAFNNITNAFRQKQMLKQMNGTLGQMLNNELQRIQEDSRNGEIGSLDKVSDYQVTLKTTMASARMQVDLMNAKINQLEADYEKLNDENDPFGNQRRALQEQIKAAQQQIDEANKMVDKFENEGARQIATATLNMYNNDNLKAAGDEELAGFREKAGRFMVAGLPGLYIRSKIDQKQKAEVQNIRAAYNAYTLEALTTGQELKLRQAGKKYYVNEREVDENTFIAAGMVVEEKEKINSWRENVYDKMSEEEKQEWNKKVWDQQSMLMNNDVVKQKTSNEIRNTANRTAALLAKEGKSQRTKDGKEQVFVWTDNKTGEWVNVDKVQNILKKYKPEEHKTDLQKAREAASQEPSRVQKNPGGSGNSFYRM